MKVVGILDWGELKEFLIYELTKCDTEEKFNGLMNLIYVSMGTKEELAEQRKKLGLSGFTKKDLEKIDNE